MADITVDASLNAPAPAAATTTTTSSSDAPVAVIPNSMWKSPALIEEGALVILFENYNSLTYCYVRANEIFQNRHGAFHHNDMIGKPFGSKVLSRKKGGSKQYMILLAPTPELWSRALRHRTQIVFTLDASAIMFQASLRSGSRVVESGTGSGALTTSFARTVAPHGHVFTFEFNPTRAEIAREEFAHNGLQDVITVDCRDACEQGFPEELAGTIDLVFLDLPMPWKAIGHATKMLKQGGNFASYSPCIEQVQKTCDALREAGFEMIRTIETRLVPYSARNIDLPTPDFGFENKTEAAEANGAGSAPSAEDDSPKPVTGQKRKASDKHIGEHLVAKKYDEIRGHTAFLTFASKFFA
ncbi:tRNA methyltransferase, partial [Globisporangium splendens]